MPALAHLGVGLATKYFNPKINVWILLAAAMLLDLLTAIFTKALWPTHGLAMAIIWSLFVVGMSAVVSSIINRTKKAKIAIVTTSITLGLLVFSHWVLDFIGWPMEAAQDLMDVPASGTPFFFSDSPNYGLGVYKTWVGALTMEIGVLLIGLALYIVKKVQIKREKMGAIEN
jgi:hypothetical protein